jgi:hypothetical protein
MTRKSSTDVYRRGRLPIQTNGWSIATIFDRGCIAVWTRGAIYGFQAKAGEQFTHMKLWTC